MASFDIISAAGHAYRFLWTERKYLLRLAIMPMVVKLVCQGAVAAFGYETRFVQQALLMLPSYFFDGWVMAHVVRLVLYGQRWPYRTGAPPDMASLQDRAQGVMTGAVAYALTRFLLMGLFAAFYASAATAGMEGPPPGAAGDAKPGALIAMIAVLAGMLWSFRLVWLFIPAAANVSIGAFMKRIHGFGTSFYMLGVWLTAFLPLLMLFIGLTAMLTQPFAGSGGAAALPAALQIVINLLWVMTDTAIWIVSVFAITFGLRPCLLPPGPKV